MTCEKQQSSRTFSISRYISGTGEGGVAQWYRVRSTREALSVASSTAPKSMHVIKPLEKKKKLNWKKKAKIFISANEAKQEISYF